MPVGAPTTLTAPANVIRPENFRRVIQRQIETHVANQINGLTLLSSDTNDGRYSTNILTLDFLAKMTNVPGWNLYGVTLKLVTSKR